MQPIGEMPSGRRTSRHPSARRARARLLCTLAAFAACAGCASSSARVTPSPGSASAPAAPTSAIATGSPGGSRTTSAGTGSPSGSASLSCPQQVLAGMSEQQVVGQLFIIGIPAASTGGTAVAVSQAAESDVGGYILYGGSDAGVASLRALTSVLDPRLAGRAAGVLPFVAADQEGGEIQTLSGPGFSTIPSTLIQGGWSVTRLRAAAQTWGDQLRRAGVNLDFAPVLDVVPARLGTANQPIGRYDRQFGSTPDVVSSHGVAVLSGLRAAGVMATGKHFPGLGRVIGNTDVSSGVTDSQTTATDPYLAPFRAAVQAGVPFMMVSSAEYRRIDPGTPAVFSAPVMSVLRQRLHFGGLIVSDDLGAAKQVAGVPPGQRSVRFLRAGGQLVVAVRPPTVVAPMIAGVLAAQRQDPAFRATVRAAALAVLAQKQRAGLLPC